MNRDDILAALLSVFNGFDVHDRMLPELIKIISGSGYEKKLIKLLFIRLKQLTQLGVLATNLAEFEPIRDGIYSMHFSQKEFNIRILYGFLPNGSPILLLCFFERGGKRSTNYSSYIDPAIERFQERKKAYEQQ